MIILGWLNIIRFFKKHTSNNQLDISNTIEKVPEEKAYVDSSSIADDERHFYEPDEYYTYYSYPETAMARQVVTFEERKKTSISSEKGLYVAEILLLYYCQSGNYPKPKNGYPGFWWFEYGIRDVGNALDSLCKRGFIEFIPLKQSVDSLTVTELKKLLREFNAPVSGKKPELVERIQRIVSDEALLEIGLKPKYGLTDLGKKELEDNAYIPYMHKVSTKTTDSGPEDMIFNVWRINREIGGKNKLHWKEVVNAVAEKIERKFEEREELLMNDFKKKDPDGYKDLEEQDNQLASINKAELKYKEDKDIESLIEFWENIWQNDGLKFEGVYWHFRLPDLYLKVKRYDDALDFCKKIRKLKKDYAYKADTYIQKIKKRQP